MAQSLDASVSSLMCIRLIAKSVSDAEFMFLYCMTVLNSAGWNTFLTSCPSCLLAESLFCVQYRIYFISGIVFC